MPVDGMPGPSVGAPPAAQAAAAGELSATGAQVSAVVDRLAAPETSAEDSAQAGADLAAAIGAEPLPRSSLYRELLAEERTPEDLRKAGYVADWSALRFYRPARIVKPKTEAEIAEALRFARERKLTVSMAGTRHSMGGQAMRDGSVFLDMTDFRGAEYDYASQTVTVKGGTNWLDVQLYLQRFGRTVQVKQASSVFSIGGSISSNIHGEDFRFGAIGNTVKSLKVMLADGSVVRASREENPELFSHVIGGYGLFGVILEAELGTAPDEKYRQVFQSMPSSELPAFVEGKLKKDPDTHFFLTELSISPLTLSPWSFLKQALVSTWEKATVEGEPIPEFNAADKSQLHVFIEKVPYVMAMHTLWLGKFVLWVLEKYVQPLIMKEYVGRNDALTLDYDMIRIPSKTHTQVLQELFVPIGRYNEFVAKVRALAREHGPNVVYASTRFVKKDASSVLPFAKEDSMSLVLYRDEKLKPATAARMELFYRAVADAALDVGGTFYLTYQLPYTREQMLRAYPNLDEFFAAKRRYDPGELFVNSLYDKYGRGAAAAPAEPARTGLAAQIEHVVVLMLENRSFDNMLGFLKERNPEIDGLTGKESNPVDPSDPSKGSIAVTRGARYFGDANPGHEPDRVERQLNGGRMDGFVADYHAAQADKWTAEERLGGAKHIMDGFAPEQVPVFAKLAEEFVVADRWFASVPTSTFPNRAFLQMGTANGQMHSSGSTSDPEFKNAILGDTYAGPTIYDLLEKARRAWKIYYHDIVWSFLIPGVRKYPEKVVRFKRFAKDVAKGKLPAFSLIEPAYINTPTHKANDDDAPHDVREGQRLVADVYNILRSNEEVWKKTLLVITYDEHGGYYDHVAPPAAVAPDARKSEHPSFDYTRLGVRVPTILVSPWLPKGAVDHTTYDHTSILKFLQDRFGLPALTQRDAQANTFHGALLAQPRHDAPVGIVPPSSGTETNDDRRLYDPSEPRGFKAVLGAFLMGTGLKSYHYARQLPWILGRKLKSRFR